MYSIPEEIAEMVYSPLTCELCSETFTIPAEWVRHIESHSDASHCVPKKRKRSEVKNKYILYLTAVHNKNQNRFIV